MSISTKKKKSVAVVIPIYKTDLTKEEEISLKQTLKILKKYDIYFAGPESLNLKELSAIKIERFSDYYFQSIDTYNKLMLSEVFYERFIGYEYILICQLDAFIFVDRLDSFCSLDYDYIGAPWLCGIYYYIDDKHCVWHVGNGGLSLRRVNSCIKLLQSKRREIDGYGSNEDVFFSIGSAEFKVAPIEVALQFSFEREVEKCFEQNGRQLPFGCHAWERYNLEFWRKHIEQFGYIVEDKEQPGKEDMLLHDFYERQYAITKFFKEKFTIQKLKKALEQSLKDASREYVIFGAGYYGKEMCKWLKEAKLSIRYFCDNNEHLAGKVVEGYRIINRDELSALKGRINVIIAIKNCSDEVEEQLNKMGFLQKKDYVKYSDLLNIINID
ncbi:MAG: hypothetical protein IJN64_03205 [Lachnospiraceae bacterium]|nr:hypothetical protein [Lachnospiraceae bacterium]